MGQLEAEEAMKEKQVGLQGALALMVEAYELDRQGHPVDGRVSPNNPGGQMTATRKDGGKVDRTVFAAHAYEIAKAALEREKTRRGKR